MNNEIPNLTLLAIFTAVVEHGSLSKAADHFETNQSTISTALGRLKDQLGQTLFVRKGRGVEPTAFAKSLYQQVKVPVAQLNEVFVPKTQFDPKTCIRKFTLSAPEHLHLTVIEGFQKLAYRNIELEVFDLPDNENTLNEQLVNQSFDVVIDIAPAKQSNISSRALFNSDFVIVCSRQHPRVQELINQQQFMAEQHAVLELTRNELYSLQRLANLDVKERKVGFHGRSLVSNMVLASQSELLAVVPIHLAQRFQNALELQVLPMPFDYNYVEHHLLWLNKLTKDPENSWLRDTVVNLFSQ